PAAEPSRPASGPRRVLCVLPDRAGAEVPRGIEAHAVARAEVAADAESRARGLMHRESLRPDHGMLFVYAVQETRTFWMKNTRIPLSIAFATSSGKIVDIQEMEPAGDRPDAEIPRHHSARPAVYALEMEKGWFARHGIRVGDRMVLAPEVGAISPR
ncbi:MAG: DUF192 domain-containing protein, partial [Planctomycetota bacterium]